MESYSHGNLVGMRHVINMFKLFMAQVNVRNLELVIRQGINMFKLFRNLFEDGF